MVDERAKECLDLFDAFVDNHFFDDEIDSILENNRQPRESSLGTLHTRNFVGTDLHLLILTKKSVCTVTEVIAIEEDDWIFSDNASALSGR